MRIEDFKVEIWMNKYETKCQYNIAETCVKSLTLKELLSLETQENSLSNLMNMQLNYGEIEGSTLFRNEVQKLYQNAKIENIITTHGAASANHLVYEALIDSGDHVISLLPCYQQHYSIPTKFLSNVTKIVLKKENNYLPQILEIEKAITKKTKMIVLNNPNNPTGSVIEEEELTQIVSLARKYNLYVLVDEVYRGLVHKKGFTPSIFDLYEKGISTSSMSKTFSLAGLRLGFIVAHKDVIELVSRQRDYSLISCSKIVEYLGYLALKNKEKILERNLKICNQNLELVESFIQRCEGLSYLKPTGGTTALIHYNLPIPSEELCLDILNKTGVLVVPGIAFEEENHFRIGYCNDYEITKKGLKKLEEYFNEKRYKNAFQKKNNGFN